jgi:signal peptidase II
VTDVPSPQPPDPSDVPASSAEGAPGPRDAPAPSAAPAPDPAAAGHETTEAHGLRHAPHVDGDRLGVPEGTAGYVADYGRANPSYVFLFVVAGLSLLADIGSKTWAEKHLEAYPGMVDIWRDHLTLILAKNRGGAWGLLQTTSESIRRPFFLLVSVAAILFIMTLYRRLQPRQMALRWGLPFVLGGALGNVFDRVRYGQVIDFIDAHARWGGQEHHWPTFNIADVCICVGVGLMAIDMFSNKRGTAPLRAPRVPPAQSGEPVPAWQDPEGDVPPGHADGSSVTPGSTNDEGAKA